MTSREIKRLTSGREWFGYLTLENLDAVADRIRRMIGDGQPYTWVAVNEGFDYKPEVRTSQIATNVEAYRLETNGKPHGDITVVDTYGIWSVHTDVADQTEVRAQLGNERARELAYLTFSHNLIRVQHSAPAGYRLHWVAALEERDAERGRTDG